MHEPDIELQWITTEHTLYPAELQLRRKVLRYPLGLDFSEADLMPDSEDMHLIALSKDQVIGCLLLKPDKLEPEVKMRQVAVDTVWQGRGIGQMMVRESESVLGRLQFERIVLHARDTAIPFYLRMNYELYSETFFEVGIPHRAMRKNLDPGS